MAEVVRRGRLRWFDHCCVTIFRRHVVVISDISQISVTLKEWDIPFEELIVGEVIGVGRFGTVYK